MSVFPISGNGLFAVEMERVYTHTHTNTHWKYTWKYIYATLFTNHFRFVCSRRLVNRILIENTKKIIKSEK